MTSQSDFSHIGLHVQRCSLSCTHAAATGLPDQLVSIMPQPCLTLAQTYLRLLGPWHRRHDQLLRHDPIGWCPAHLRCSDRVGVLCLCCHTRAFVTAVLRGAAQSLACGGSDLHSGRVSVATHGCHQVTGQHVQAGGALPILPVSAGVPSC